MQPFWITAFCRGKGGVERRNEDEDRGGMQRKRVEEKDGRIEHHARVIFSSLFRNKESGCAELQIETRYFSQLRFIL